MFCVPAQIQYLGKILLLRYGPKCFQPIRFQVFKINYISRINGWNSRIFYKHAETNSQKLKVNENVSSEKSVQLIWSQEWTDGINWFFACWYIFRKSKNCFNYFGVTEAKNVFFLWDLKIFNSLMHNGPKLSDTH